MKLYIVGSSLQTVEFGASYFGAHWSTVKESFTDSEILSSLPANKVFAFVDKNAALDYEMTLFNEKIDHAEFLDHRPVFLIETGMDAKPKAVKDKVYEISPDQVGRVISASFCHSEHKEVLSFDFQKYQAKYDAMWEEGGGLLALCEMMRGYIVDKSCFARGAMLFSKGYNSFDELIRVVSKGDLQDIYEVLMAQQKKIKHSEVEYRALINSAIDMLTQYQLCSPAVKEEKKEEKVEDQKLDYIINILR